MLCKCGEKMEFIWREALGELLKCPKCAFEISQDWTGATNTTLASTANVYEDQETYEGYGVSPT